MQPGGQHPRMCENLRVHHDVGIEFQSVRLRRPVHNLSGLASSVERLSVCKRSRCGGWQCRKLLECSSRRPNRNVRYELPRFGHRALVYIAPRLERNWVDQQHVREGCHERQCSVGRSNCVVVSLASSLHAPFFPFR